MAAAPDFHPLPIATVTREPGDALVITFAVPAALRETFRFKPGQHIAIRAMIDGGEQRRNYSICSGPNEPLRVAIKAVADGRFSSWAHATLAAKQTLEIMPPSGRFVLPASDGTPRHIVAFAAGSGITPVLGVTRQALEHEAATRVTLVYGNRTRDTVMFGEELEALKDKHLGRFEFISVYSMSGEVESPLLEGRINAAKVKAFGDTLIRYADADYIFLCGPGSLIKEARDTLMALGVPREKIIHEFFGSGGGAHKPATAKPAAAAAQATTKPGTPVTVILDGVRHRLTLEPNETVLQAALKAGVKAPYACAGGMCSTCRAHIVEGSATMLLNYALEPWETEKGFILACQAIPTSERLVIDWDAM
jgi:ring-1,2-phenylacetyl-CoA epoxidase subunit PaaE